MSSDRPCSQCGTTTPHEYLPAHEVIRNEAGRSTEQIHQKWKCSSCGMSTVENPENITFELLGGFYDGATFDPAIRELDSCEVRIKYLQTHGGEIGRRFWMSGGQYPHMYEVAERIYENGELIIRMKYIGVSK